MPYEASSANQELEHYRLKLRQIDGWLREMGGVVTLPGLSAIRLAVSELVALPWSAPAPTTPSAPSEIPLHEITMVKVFSENRHKERNRVGEKITAWLAERPDLRIVRTEVSQSSDSEFHCLTITLFLTSPIHRLK